ncbi:MAG: J domain-containing protein, partial [Parachlamydiales bacterium]|nr:J domain-containing protein [Parachlamydiales bacterium]
FVNIVFSTKNKERYQQRLNILLALAKKTAQETSLSFQRVVNLFRLIIRNFIRRNFSDTQALAHQEQILQALAKEEASFKMAANLFRFIMLSSPFSRLFSVTASAFFSIPITTQRAVFFKSLDGEIVEQIYLRIPDKYKLLITPRQLQDNIALQILFINHIPEEFFPIPVTPEKKAIFQSLNGQTVEQIYSRIPDEYKRLITPRQLNESPVLEALQQSRRFSSRRESSSSHREPSFRVSCPIESYLNTMGISPEDWNTTSDKQQLLSKRYRSLARENHPDKHPNDIERARETMAKINDAYSRLQAHLRET